MSRVDESHLCSGVVIMPGNFLDVPTWHTATAPLVKASGVTLDVGRAEIERWEG